VRKALLFAFACAGCASSSPPSYPSGPTPRHLTTFVVDDAFRDGEKAHIVAAAKVWMGMGVPLAIVSGRDAYRTGVPPYTVWIVNVERTACGEHAAGCWVPPARIEFDGNTLTSSGAWETVAQHEIGHALGLHDVNDGLSVMRSGDGDRAARPSYEDVLTAKYHE
jgi:hypothetical protein